MMFTLLLVGMLTLAFNIRTVKSDWGGIVTIRADGSVDPSTAPIDTCDNVTYILTDNINGSVIVERSNIIIDGNKCVVQGFRIYEANVNNVTIQNANIEGSDFGILFDSSSNNTVLGNNITAASEYGIYCQWSSGNVIYGNRITNSAAGIRLQKSSNNTLRYNIMTNNTYNFGVFGTEFSHFVNDIDVSNTVDGKSIHYLINQHDMLVSSEAGYVGLINCTGITAENLNLSKNLEGVLLAYTTNSTITQCNITNNMDGIMLFQSVNNSILGNTFSNDGLYVYDSYNNTVEDNLVNGKPLVYFEDTSDYTVENAGQVILVNCNNIHVENLNLSKTSVGIELWRTNSTCIINSNITNNGDGISIFCSLNNNVENNNISGNIEGIYLGNSSDITIANNTITLSVWQGIMGDYASGMNIFNNNIAANNYEGIMLYYSSNNNVTNNKITENNYGYGIYLWNSSKNSVSTNSIVNNLGGIMLWHSSNNNFYHNNFINNTMQATTRKSYDNAWDDGYPSGGNYWSDYNGMDVDGDGIGDTPYIIDENNTDRYPLIHPWSPLPVHNINTGLGYTTIQEAINANETLNGHTIFVEAGTYYENVIVNKTVSIIGESKATTLIDGNRTAEAVIITANNTLLSGFTIKSRDPFIVAIRLENVSHTTITNNTITNSFSGLAVAFSDSNLIAGNNITKNTFRDALVNSSNNVLRDNTMEGLYISKSINNTLVGNTIGSFMLSYSPNTTLRNNSFSVFGVYGDKLSDFVQAIDSSNTVNGKPIYYWVNHENAEVPSDAGYVALINCANVTVRGLNFENNFQSILMFSTNNSRILNNNVTNINEGIWIFSSSNNIIYGNNITYSCIQLLNGCSNNNIHSNNITTSGILLSQSSNNSIFHNNFINALVNSYKSTNTWDDGYPSGGNYWSGYVNVDVKSGAGQNLPGSDGVGDTVYVIDVNNTDSYPLMGPINTFEAGVWNGTEYFVDVVSNSTVSNFHFNPDEGPFLRFNLTGDDTAGFCRVTIPKSLLRADDGWTITVGDQPITNYTIIPDENFTYLYFTYNHSTQTVLIQGTWVIPEFPSSLALLGFLTLITISLTFAKKKRFKKAKT